MSSGDSLAEIDEDSESLLALSLPEETEERVFVAVGKAVRDNRLALLWALRNGRGKKVCILHVHQPAQMIPMSKLVNLISLSKREGWIFNYGFFFERQ